MAILRQKSDIRTLAFSAIYGALVLTQWNYPGNFPLWVSVCLFAWTCHFAFIGAITTHNCVHTPMFTRRWMNSLYQVYLTLTIGHPVSTYVPGHNLSHHKFLQSRKDIMRTYKMRYNWNFLNLLMFVPTINSAVQRNDTSYFLAQRKLNRTIWKQIRLEIVCFYPLQALLLYMDWRRYLLTFFLPHLFAKYCIATMNMLQHDGCDEFSKVNFSRNFTGNLVNWWYLNNGYHSVHHINPGMHWSLLPEEHNKILKPHIHPNLDQENMLKYIWTTYVYPGKRERFDGTPYVFPPDAFLPPLDWAYDMKHTYDSKENESTE